MEHIYWFKYDSPGWFVSSVITAGWPASISFANEGLSYVSKPCLICVSPISVKLIDYIMTSLY